MVGKTYGLEQVPTKFPLRFNCSSTMLWPFDDLLRPYAVPGIPLLLIHIFIFPGVVTIGRNQWLGDIGLCVCMGRCTERPEEINRSAVTDVWCHSDLVDFVVTSQTSVELMW